MTKISTKIATALTGAAAVTAAGLLAPAAHADNGMPAVTQIYWTGTNCILVESAQQYNPSYAATGTVCGGTWRFSEGNIWPGDLFGANPIMGNASYIECAVFRGGVRVWSDSAFAGDGSDVNCLRRAI
jgi:hypothetical protein